MTEKKVKRPFVLPPPREGSGRPPLEYVLMPSAEAIIAKLEGDGDDLLTPTKFAAALDTFAQWARNADRTGRGPKPSRCGRAVMFRRSDVIEWLRFLAKEHKARMRKAA